jgi:hypothetical protein
MKLKEHLLELEDAWRILDGYAVHAAGCPRVWGMGGACNCGLTAVRDRLRRAVLDLVMHYGIHDAECPAVLGNKCDCGLDSARRRLRLFARPSRPDVTGGTLPPTDRGAAESQEAFGISLLRQAQQRVRGVPPATEGPHYDTPLADAANEALEELLERVNTLPGDQQVGAMTMIAYGMVMEHLRLASWTQSAAPGN